MPNAKINAILAYINGSLHQRITLDDLEKAFYINKYHLCHIFKQNTGFAILEYISYKRILRAKELLAEGQSAAEAAVQVGYSDYSTFFRAFKNIVGISPNKYKKIKGTPALTCCLSACRSLGPLTSRCFIAACTV